MPKSKSKSMTNPQKANAVLKGEIIELRVALENTIRAVRQRVVAASAVARNQERLCASGYNALIAEPLDRNVERSSLYEQTFATEPDRQRLNAASKIAERGREFVIELIAEALLRREVALIFGCDSASANEGRPTHNGASASELLA
jgi:hypothetical protein